MGLSRNKVAVSEGAAGSPPFYGERATCQTTTLYKFLRLTRSKGREIDRERNVVQYSRKDEEEESEEKVSATNAEGPPVPIPNTEVKLCSGDNTLRETVREDSSVLTSEGSREICSLTEKTKCE